MKNKTVILAGSGHAHLEVIKALSRAEISKHRFILVSPTRDTYYSGLIPRLLNGEIDDSKLKIQSAKFAEAKGFEYIEDSIRTINRRENCVLLRSGRTEPFDFLSMNIGGTPRKFPTESPSTTIYLRPFDDFIPSWRAIESSFSAGASPRFVVVGGGAAAVEVATALQLRINRSPSKRGNVHLVTRGPRLCEGYCLEVSASIFASATKLGIHVHCGETVTKILDQHLLLRDGKQLDFDFIFIATPTEPSAELTDQTDSSLRLSANIFAAGDCTAMKDHPDLPRSGVTAVHQGRHLAISLRAVLNGETPTAFVPRKRLVNILLSGDRTGRFVWGDLSFEGKLALHIKDWIDDQYMKSFRLPTEEA